MKLGALREAVWEANLDIVEAGLVTLTWGNVSAVDRTAGMMAIKPSGVPYDELEPARIVLVALDSGDTVDSEDKPSSDTKTHLALYRGFEGVGAVVHTHSPFATSWAQACREIPCLGTTHADGFAGPVPLARELTQEETAADYEGNMGKAILERFEPAGLDPLAVPAVLLPRHGPFAWGATLDEALDAAITLEEVAEMALYTLQINPEIQTLSEPLRQKHFSRKHGPNAYYGQRG